jgi:hypothetical protein
MLGSASRGPVFHGRPAQRAGDAAVALALGGGEPLEAAVPPVAIDGQVVRLLCVDNGTEPLAPSALAALGARCDAVRDAHRRPTAEQTRRLD